MERYTRHIDEHPCRIANGCPIDDWIEECIEGDWRWKGDTCDYCPFMELINRLGEFEDMAEHMEDDKK